jgi:hypothetical protein
MVTTPVKPIRYPVERMVFLCKEHNQLLLAVQSLLKEQD